MADEYRRFFLTSSAAVEREMLLAEAFAAGAEGAEESEEGAEFQACVYAPATGIEAIRETLIRIARPDTRIGDAEALPDVDWSEAWKAEIESLRISSRLIVRPPFIDVELEPGQVEVVIDPGQAFPLFDGPELIELLEGGAVYVVNDYEWEVTLERTGLSEDEIAARVGAIVVTKED